MEVELTADQHQIVQAPLDAHIFLEGPAGSGKTTVGAARLAFLLQEGLPGSQILVLVPQRTLGLPYLRAARHPGAAAGGMVDVATIGGLARRMVELFWPLVAGPAGFEHPAHPPTFLSIETAQYHMALIVRPLLEQGYFEGAAIDRNRIYSQILDNLNKAAFVGFPHEEIGARLQDAWIEQPHQRRIYLDAQECASRFRQYCLENNLLDFSLMLEVFLGQLWSHPVCRDYLQGHYRHLLVDNIEEDTPVAHDLLLEWLPHFTSSFLIYDQTGGFRRFLGADPVSAYRLKDACPTQLQTSGSFVASEPVRALRGLVSLVMERPVMDGSLDLAPALYFEHHRYYPQMLSWVSEQIRYLVAEIGVEPGEIVVLAPFLSDALRFSLMNRLENAGIPVQSHRPSRSLREEPATQCMLTLAAIAHPQWDLQPAVSDVSYALRQAIEGLDLVRAQLLAEVLYRSPEDAPSLLTFSQVQSDMQERITFVLGGRYETFRIWLQNYLSRRPDALDHFFSRLFGELLSQSGFRFHQDLDAGKVVANLIDSARQFRLVVGPQIEAAGEAVGRVYLQTVQEGLLASQYLRSWEHQQDNAVLVAPAYTFLMANRPVDYQFWLNVSSGGWQERLYQPLTHPYVLSRQWTRGQRWTDQDEVSHDRESLFRLLNGLLNRCRQGVFLGLSELDEHGGEQKGPLLNVIQRVLRSAGTADGAQP